VAVVAFRRAEGNRAIDGLKPIGKLFTYYCHRMTLRLILDGCERQLLPVLVPAKLGVIGETDGVQMYMHTVSRHG